jgi:hypothetical protein
LLPAKKRPDESDDGSRRLRPAWWTLADPEGNEVDIANWKGRE